ncbi:MAG: dTDP-glucose 4,6-dehydratase [Bacteroidales bacterium]|nr:dTDP-glucose 4,6-dehydratase [Bacteroidales bacterium]
MKRILVTGGAGFIGSNFIRYMLRKYGYEIVNADLLTYAGNLDNLTDIKDNPNYSFVKADISNFQDMEPLFDGVSATVNFAAESHVDRSIIEPQKFLTTNILGTQILLDLAKRYKVQKFIQISTDEVYGSLGESGFFTEETSLSPNSPYSASKAGADLLVMAYHATYGLDVSITRCSNNYGQYQFPEKLIPLIIINAINNKKLPVYGDGMNVRDWIHVEDHCAAIDLVLHKGKAGWIYNVGCNNERTNISIVKTILSLLGKDESLIEFVKDRPGHDRRYAIDTSRIKKELGWHPKFDFNDAIKDTVKWYMENEDWWNKIINGDYRKYYNEMYGGR